MNHIEKGGIIFINKNNNLLAGLLINTFNQISQTYIGITVFYKAIVFLLITTQHIVQHLLQSLFIHMLCDTHVKMQHRILRPFRLQLLDSQSFEQIFLPIKIAMKRRHQQ